MNGILMDVRTTYLIVPNGGIITWITILVVVIDVVKLKRFEIISSFYTLHHKTSYSDCCLYTVVNNLLTGRETTSSYFILRR